jgi:hypothetical protein
MLPLRFNRLVLSVTHSGYQVKRAPLPAAFIASSSVTQHPNVIYCPD